jgi:hypothetical protein
MVTDPVGERKKKLTFKEKNIKVTSYFFSESIEERREWNKTSKMFKEKKENKTKNLEFCIL